MSDCVVRGVCVECRECRCVGVWSERVAVCLNRAGIEAGWRVERDVKRVWVLLGCMHVCVVCQHAAIVIGSWWCYGLFDWHHIIWQ